MDDADDVSNVAEKVKYYYYYALYWQSGVGGARAVWAAVQRPD